MCIYTTCYIHTLAVPVRNTQYARINTQYARIQYARIQYARIQYARIQYETDGKASRNRKNKAPLSAATHWVSCFSYSYLLFHLSRSDTCVLDTCVLIRAYCVLIRAYCVLRIGTAKFAMLMQYPVFLESRMN